MNETQTTDTLMTDLQALGYLEVVDTPALTLGNLRRAVERCLAAGMSPRAIEVEVGMTFWGMVKGGVSNPEPTRRWPRSELGGWSDEPCLSREA